MSDIDNEQSSSGLGVNDILFILFRHKWTIALCTFLGLAGAAVVYFLMPPAYESQAKLLVPYVVERSAIDSVDSQVKMTTENLINSEVEILTSRDLALQIVEAISAERLVPGAAGKATVADAVRNIQQTLSVTPLKGSNIILLSYKNEDPELAKQVLEELVTHYRSKHLEVHRSIGTFDFVTQQTDQIRMRLTETEENLKQLKAKEGIISLAETSTTLNGELTRTQDELRAAETELEEQRARVKELEKWVGNTGPGAEPGVQPARDIVQQYQILTARLAKLRQSEFELLSKYTPESSMAVRMREQIETVENQRRSLEKKNPSLVATAPVTSSAAPEQGPDLLTERARLASLEAKAAWLKSRLNDLRQSILRFSEISPQIAQLERKREMEEANYKYYEASLEKARIDEALDPAKLPNISVVQKPSVAARAISKTKKKIVLGIAGCGLGLGIAIALLMELIVDRSVKRPLEFESQLRIPMFCWIPMVGRNGNQLMNSRHDRGDRQLALPANDTFKERAPWELGHFIRSFSEEIRNRLVLYFEIKKTTHKPKLIAVTSCTQGAGTSTIAGGIAAALSEMRDGKVLLVDMHDAAAGLHPFFEGQPVFSLSDALEPQGAMCAAAENLYLATASLRLSEAESIAPKTFYNMVPRFHSSDFDYVVFDMPPLDQSSSTLALARFMDKVLMVVESEKSSRDSVQRSYSDLKFANPNVSAVLNKTRSYTPRWLGSDC